MHAASTAVEALRLQSRYCVGREGTPKVALLSCAQPACCGECPPWQHVASMLTTVVPVQFGSLHQPPSPGVIKLYVQDKCDSLMFHAPTFFHNNLCVGPSRRKRTGFFLGFPDAFADLAYALVFLRSMCTSPAESDRQCLPLLSLKRPSLR